MTAFSPQSAILKRYGREVLVIVDFHTHILPGLDDGCATSEESVDAARMLRSQGVSTVVATPHYLPGHFTPVAAEVRSSTEKLRLLLTDEGIDLELLPGHEIMVHRTLAESIRTQLVLPIGGSGTFVLVEFPLYELPWFAMTTIDHLVELGYVPIIAHPERCLPLHKESRELRSWFHKGVLTQLDIASLMGQHGSDVQHVAEMMIRDHLVHLVGSDLHGPTTRAQLWTETIRRIARLGGQEYAETVSCTLPKAILTGEDIRFLVPSPRETKKFSIRRLADSLLGNSLDD
jgi:protein-tyrosine phosphatase